MTLTSRDYERIAAMLTDGANTLEYVKCNETISIEYKLEIEGYEEDDYYNGTGSFIETSKKLYVENVESWNEEGDDTTNDFKEEELSQWVA